MIAAMLPLTAVLQTTATVPAVVRQHQAGGTATPAQLPPQAAPTAILDVVEIILKYVWGVLGLLVNHVFMAAAEEFV